MRAGSGQGSIERAHLEEGLLMHVTAYNVMAGRYDTSGGARGKKGCKVGRGHILMSSDAIRRSSNCSYRHAGVIKMPSAASYSKLRPEWLK